MKTLKYLGLGIIVLVLLNIDFNKIQYIEKNQPNKEPISFNRRNNQQEHGSSKKQTTPQRKIASKAVSQSPMDSFNKEDFGFVDFQIVTGVSISEVMKPSKTLLMRSGKMFYYQEQDNLFHNVVFDKRRNAYALWTGVISLKAKRKTLEQIVENYSISFVGKNLFFAANLKAKDGFDFTKDIQEILNTDGVYDMKLDLIYSRLTQR